MPHRQFCQGRRWQHQCQLTPASPAPSPVLQLTTCCFDKTGTLTADEMVLEGIAGTAGPEDGIVADAKSLPPAIQRVLACCQSLLQVGCAASCCVMPCLLCLMGCVLGCLQSPLLAIAGLMHCPAWLACFCDCRLCAAR